jgi:hypothetical protein
MSLGTTFDQRAVRVDEPKSYWQSRLLNQLQGPSSLGMGLSGGAVGFSASIINPDTYVGFWTSVAFQTHAGFQFLSVAFGVMFVICRLRNNDVTSRLGKLKPEDAPAGDLDHLQHQSRRLAKITRSMIYGQIILLFAGALAFIWLMLLHFQHALYL